MSQFRNRLAAFRARGIEAREAQRAPRVRVWRSRKASPMWQESAWRARASWTPCARMTAQRAMRARLPRKAPLAAWMGRGRGGKASRLAWRLRVVAPRMTERARVWRARGEAWKEAGAYGGAWRAHYFATARDDVARVQGVER